MAPVHSPRDLNSYLLFVNGLNGVSWTLCCEVAFYALWPGLLAWWVLLRLRWIWLTAVTAWALWLLALLAGPTSEAWRIYLTIFPPLRVGEFLLGVALALTIERGWRCPARLGATLAFLAVLAGVLRLLSFTHRTLVPGAVLDVAFVAVIAAAASTDLRGKPGMLCARWPVYAGEVSFAFYLVHLAIIRNVPSHVHVSSTLMVPVVAAASVAGAVGLHHLVEQPAQRWLASSRGARQAT